MLLQTNSYIVPKEKRTEHARLLQRFRQLMTRLGCDHFEVFEQVGANWAGSETGRFVQIMRFRDRQQWAAVQAAEKNDTQAKQLIAEFCDLINLPYQQQAGLFVSGYYNSVIAAQMPATDRPVAMKKAVSVTGIAAAASAAAAAQADGDSSPEDDISAAPVEAVRTTRPETPGSDEPVDLTCDDLKPEIQATTANDAANGDIDILDYLDDVEPSPAAADEVQRERID